MSSSNCGQNVLDHHGADPTGTTDSTGAFLRAIAALGSRGGIVAIPAGRYRIDGAPISVRTPVCFRGAWGIERTGRDWSGAVIDGSTTTLMFPHDRDGFVVEPNTRVGFENLALVRNRQDPNDPDKQDPPRFARRGIYAKGPIYADSLYLVFWERGIQLDGSATHPHQPEDPDGYNVNGSRVERIFAEDCLWGTYTAGFNAQGCHFLDVYCLSCGAGIYDSSLGGNGYVNCYVEQAEAPTEPPYYIDNQSVLFNCRCEHKFPPQLGGSVQAIGGAFNVNASPALRAVLGIVDPNPLNAGFRQINGVPGRIVSNLFKTSGFIGGEQIEVTVDGQTSVITFSAADQSPAGLMKIGSRGQRELILFLFRSAR
ncbi:MAG: hypothetical protein HOP18_07195 [Deltaproteobacteria bacterium]|nr:hypothetical protein [Deltaproteobacteria bacterium]